MRFFKLIFNTFNKFFYFIASAASLLLAVVNTYIKGINPFLIFLYLFAICLLCFQLKKKCKIFNVFPKNKIIIIITILFFASMSNIYAKNDYVVKGENINGGNVSPAILTDEIEIDLDIKSGKFNQLRLQFATYRRPNDKAKYNILLYKNDSIIFTEVYNAEVFKDVEYTTFNIGYQNANKDDLFKVIVKPISTDGENCVSLFYNSKTDAFNYQIISGEINVLKESLIFIFLIAFLFVNYISNSKKIDAHKFYLLLLIYFIPLVFLVPALDIPDEPAHFYRAYKISEIISTNKKLNNPFNEYLKAPDTKCLFYGKHQSINKTFNKSKAYKCLKNTKNQTFDDIDYLRSRNPYIHLVPAIGIKIADTFSNSPLLIFMVGRIVNMLVSFLLIYFILKRSPKNKILFLFIATIPIFVQQMISYSYDSLLNSFSLYITYLLIYIQSKERTDKLDDVLFMIGTTYLICSKLVYILLVIPFFFMRTYDSVRDFFAKNKKYILMFFVPIFVYLGWELLSAHFYKNPTSIVMGGSSHSNLNYIINNPSKIFLIAVNTFKNRGWFYLQSLYGNFGWFTFQLENIIIYIFIFMMFSMVVNKNLPSIYFKKGKKTIGIISFFVIFALIFAALYFAWSSYKLNYVEGVQGRYFLPILPLLLICLTPKKQFDISLKEKDYYLFANLSLIIYIVSIICYVY